MSRLGPNLIFAAAALLLVGAGAWLIAKRQLVAEIAAAQATPDPELVRLRADYKERIQRQRALTPPPAPAPSVAASSSGATLDPAKRAQIIAEIFQGGFLGRTAWPPPSRNLLANGIADLAEILGLNSAETAVLQQAAEKAEKEFAAAIAAHTTIERAGALVTLTLQSHPDLTASYDRLQAAIAGTLGPERYRAYETFGGRDALTKLFDRWGMQGTTLNVFHGSSSAIPDAFYAPRFDGQGNRISGAPRGRGGLDRVLYHYTQFQAPPPGARGGGGASHSAGAESIDTITLNVGPLGSLIPPDL